MVDVSTIQIEWGGSEDFINHSHPLTLTYKSARAPLAYAVHWQDVWVLFETQCLTSNLSHLKPRNGCSLL